MYVVTARQMRGIDSRAIHEWGIPGMVLMENAAKAVVSELSMILGQENREKKVLVMAGKGNNGGDGLAVARHLQILGYGTRVYLFADARELSGDARHNYTLYEKMAGHIHDAGCDGAYEDFCRDLSDSDVVVDALYGTGFSGELPERIVRFMQRVNDVAITVVAVDIASGLDAQSGQAAEAALQANVTVTFGLPKLGHFLGDGPDYTGRLVLDTISLPQHVIAAEKIRTRLMTADMAKSMLPRRSRGGHKGAHGCGLIIGGSIGMSGAVILAGRAALRCGIGLVQIVTPACIASTVDAGIPEATVWPSWPLVEQGTMDARAWDVIAERLVRAQASAGRVACAVGPGLKQPPEFMDVLERLLKKSEIPLILDADALNLLAAHMSVLAERQAAADACPGNLILTPHPGEMARLCGMTIAEVQHDRLGLTARKAEEWNAVVVLKGAATIVASPTGAVVINTSGNSGLGTGGTGDALTGSILAWLAQGVSPFEAAALAVYLHGRSADHLALTHGAYGFTAAEVADTLSVVRRSLEYQECGSVLS